jgi:hypothetical protein
VPGTIVHDRSKTIVKRHARPGKAVPLLPGAVAFAEYYGFVIDVLAAYRPAGKGRVEQGVVGPRAFAVMVRCPQAATPRALAHLAVARAAHSWVGQPFELARILPRVSCCAVPAAVRRPRAAAGSARPFRGPQAESWAGRCSAELAATGPPRPRSADNGASRIGLLTPQELQVAREIAAGRSNPEAAGGAVPQPQDRGGAPDPDLPRARGEVPDRPDPGAGRCAVGGPLICRWAEPADRPGPARRGMLTGREPVGG